jgi:hypothetical protein
VLHLGVGSSAVLGGFSHGDQFGYLWLFGHALTPWPPLPISGEGGKGPHPLAPSPDFRRGGKRALIGGRNGGALSVRKDVLVYFTINSYFPKFATGRFSQMDQVFDLLAEGLCEGANLCYNNVEVHCL